jgi:tetratricopeptide (TPR) repeat protein
MSEPIPSPELRSAPAPTPCEDALSLFEDGTQSLRAGRYHDAHAALVRAERLAPRHAQIRASLGLAIAYVERDFERARELCESAAEQEFFNPDAYLHLARVHLVFGYRSEALRHLRRGEMIDPGHPEIRDEIAGLGRRGVPVVPFLPRRHPINRALGGARSLLRSGLSRRVAA